METVTFDVPSISCEHCVATIQRVVKEEVPGVGEVLGDPETKRVSVEFAPPATVDAIESTMTAWDFPPQRV
jgi:copper chaperone CopZ